MSSRSHSRTCSSSPCGFGRSRHAGAFLGAGDFKSGTSRQALRVSFPFRSGWGLIVIVLWSWVGVGDERYPYLKTELDLVRMRLERQLPLLGVCLGAQMMAHALGARVYPGTAREIGWGPISLTEAGRLSPLRHLEGNTRSALHGDTFDVPSGARLLASTEITPHQAFCAGSMRWLFSFI